MASGVGASGNREHGANAVAPGGAGIGGELPAGTGLHAAHGEKTVGGEAITAGAARVDDEGEAGRSDGSGQIKDESLEIGACLTEVSGEVDLTDLHLICGIGAFEEGEGGASAVEPGVAAIAGGLPGGVGLQACKRDGGIAGEAIALVAAGVSDESMHWRCRWRDIDGERREGGEDGADIARGIALADADLAGGVRARRHVKGLAGPGDPAGAGIGGELPICAEFQSADEDGAVVGDAVGCGAAGIALELQHWGVGWRTCVHREGAKRGVGLTEVAGCVHLAHLHLRFFIDGGSDGEAGAGTKGPGVAAVGGVGPGGTHLQAADGERGVAGEAVGVGDTGIGHQREGGHGWIGGIHDEGRKAGEHGADVARRIDLANTHLTQAIGASDHREGVSGAFAPATPSIERKLPGGLLFQGADLKGGIVGEAITVGAAGVVGEGESGRGWSGDIQGEGLQGAVGGTVVARQIALAHLNLPRAVGAGSNGEGGAGPTGPGGSAVGGVLPGGGGFQARNHQQGVVGHLIVGGSAGVCAQVEGGSEDNRVHGEAREGGESSANVSGGIDLADPHPA